MPQRRQTTGRTLRIDAINYAAVAFSSIVLFCGSCRANAATYYVAPNGSDAYTLGQAQSQSTPWASARQACSLLKPGDTVDILPGTYSANSWSIKVVGTPCKQITFIGNNGAKPQPVLIDSAWSAIDISASHYVVVKNIAVTSTDTDPSTSSYGISIYGGSTHITVEGCTVHDCGGGGIGTTNQGGLGCDYISILDNVIYNDAWYSKWDESGISLWEQSNSNPSDTGVHNLISGNVCYDNSNKYTSQVRHTDGEGIIVDCGYSHSSQQSGTDSPDATTLVTQNICYDNGGSGMECYQDDDVLFTQNTCYKDAQDPAYSGGGELFINGATRCEVSRNICFSTISPRDVPIAVYSDSGTSMVFGNCFYGGATTAVKRAGNTYADPGFESPDDDPPDFQVAKSGPADPNGETMGACKPYK